MKEDKSSGILQSIGWIKTHSVKPVSHTDNGPFTETGSTVHPFRNNLFSTLPHMAPFIQVWLLLQCCKQQRRQNKMIMSFLIGIKKENACQPSLLLGCCVAVEKLHITQLLFLPVITQHKLRASLLASSFGLCWSVDLLQLRTDSHFPWAMQKVSFQRLSAHLSNSHPTALPAQLQSFCHAIELRVERPKFGLAYFVLRRTKHVEMVFSFWLLSKFHLFCF